MFDLVSFIQTAGYAGIFGIVFVECGFVFGFFLPGDSLLFTAGVLASQGYLNIAVLVATLFMAAVGGYSLSYSIGRRIGPKIFKKEDSLFFHKDHLERTRKFYAKHGGKAVILTRFMPIIRTFAPLMAGVGRMRPATFLFYNVVGGLLWAVGMPMLGFYLGRAIPRVDLYLMPIVLAIIGISFIPTVVHIWRDKDHRAAIIAFVKNRFKVAK